MWWRISNKMWKANGNPGNHAAMKALVDSGVQPGLLGYIDGRVASWVSVGPRKDYMRLGSSKLLAPVDDQPVWVIVCFYTLKGMRRSGMMTHMLLAAEEYAKEHGARILEAFPYDTPPAKRFTSLTSFMGVTSVFRKLGFVEVARRTEFHPVMRKIL